MTEGWDLTGIPPWIWPYVRTARVGEGHVALSVYSSLLAFKNVAGRSQNQKLIHAAKTALADFEDDWCGTGPKPWPPVVLGVASELMAFAHGLPEENDLRADTLASAQSLASRAFE